MEKTDFNNFYKDLILLSRILRNLNAADVFNLLILHENAQNRVQAALSHHFKSEVEKRNNVTITNDMKLIKSVFPSLSIEEICDDFFQLRHLSDSDCNTTRAELVAKKHLLEKKDNSSSVGLKRTSLDYDDVNVSTSKKTKLNDVESESTSGEIQLDASNGNNDTLNVTQNDDKNASSIEVNVMVNVENITNIGEGIINIDENRKNNDNLNSDHPTVLNSITGDNINKEGEKLSANPQNENFEKGTLPIWTKALEKNLPTKNTSLPAYFKLKSPVIVKMPEQVLFKNSALQVIRDEIVNTPPGEQAKLPIPKVYISCNNSGGFENKNKHTFKLKPATILKKLKTVTFCDPPSRSYIRPCPPLIKKELPQNALPADSRLHPLNSDNVGLVDYMGDKFPNAAANSNTNQKNVFQPGFNLMNLPTNPEPGFNVLNSPAISERSIAHISYNKHLGATNSNSTGPGSCINLIDLPHTSAANNSADIPRTSFSGNRVRAFKQEIPATIVRPVDTDSDSDDDTPLERRMTNFDKFYTVLNDAHRGNDDATPSSLSENTDVEDDDDITYVKSYELFPETTLRIVPTGDHEYYFKILEMFPDICPTYLRQFLLSTQNTSLDHIITQLLEGDYKKRNAIPQPTEEEHLDFETQYSTLLELFPEADPTFLQDNCEQLIDHPEAYKAFVARLIETKNYPSKKDYIKRMHLSAQEKQYTTEFDVEKFLQLIPDPIKHFSNRTPARLQEDDSHYALIFLKNHYGHLTIREINEVFKQCKFDIIYAAGALALLPKSLKSKRKAYPLTSCKNIPLLQELAYIKHNKEILDFIKAKEVCDQEAKLKAKEEGILKCCECCYDDEIMPDDIVMCDNGHKFCKDCVRKGCEVKIGEGKLDFPCLADCDQKFSLQILQHVLTPKLFSKMAQRKQLEEVKAAGIEDLEFCPFCDFATIPAPGDKLFRCMNNDCMKESCRECKEPSHIPLRCDEVEKEQDVKQRTYIENKMTDALLRECYKCGLKFIKDSGCNKMTCSCGALMCYVCNKPVKDYTHFNGQGGDKHHLCPLYSDTNALHLNAIKRSAEDAKKELGLNTNSELKIDPAQDIDKHYKSKGKTHLLHLHGLERNLLRIQQHLAQQVHRDRVRQRQQNRNRLHPAALQPQLHQHDHDRDPNMPNI